MNLGIAASMCYKIQFSGSKVAYSGYHILSTYQSTQGLALLASSRFTRIFKIVNIKTTHIVH